ncbi:hypothetical protein DPM19_28910 [Actinomadura craniellae]|uniref:DUF1707 domain-containing protein n=1 Tax=Actinomadura craniellae TaxID=2231787 RepID=A0A365GXU5_9ACTN|nr:DUF1707 domain-containing protein [Actinomadura craniellae]RAY11649.1 hypothetical protein DPM19_28910 [Actinomadura craniellae]
MNHWQGGPPVWAGPHAVRRLIGAEAAADELRIGDAERDAVASALHEHFGLGRLTAPELDERLEAALTAKTRGDLRQITRDLPEPHGLSDAGSTPHRRRHPGHPGHRHRFPGGPLLLILLIALVAGGLEALVVAVQVVLVLMVAAAVFSHARRRKHS